jgi:tRNA pseudouridine38-40 synthase
MNRYFIELSFKGSAYHGWQLQPNADTVQKQVNHALSILLKESIETTGAGRTDTGVHARFFVAHFDSDQLIMAMKSRFMFGLNSILPKDIAVKDIYLVKPSAHARYDAFSRTYEYRISRKKDPFENDFSWYYPHPLDIELMNQASEKLLSHSDFTSFSKLHSDVKTQICSIMNARWEIRDTMLIFTIVADRFLRNMVRAIVGTLIGVGRAKISTAEFEKIILARKRSESSPSVPAKGLFLTGINYPESLKL